MSEKLSKTEKENVQKIYDIIRNNSRMSFAGIAKETKLTRQTVAKLFEKMEKSKLIWGYCAVIDPKKFGYNTYVLLVKTKPSFKGDFETVERFLKEKEMKNMMIIYSGLFHGEYDWVVLFLAKDLITARKYVNRYIEGYNEFIEDIKLEEQLVTTNAVGFQNPNITESLKQLI